MKNSSKNQSIDPDKFFEHFKELNTKRNMFSGNVGDFENTVLRKLKLYQQVNKTVPDLDKNISLGELRKTIQSLPNRKAVGVDGLLNEMFKAGIDELSPSILLLFNNILNDGVFPELWTKGMIVPIAKSCGTDDPNNYRGITITSCLGKLFTKVMANRLTMWVSSTNILSEFQIGFKPGSRTADHVFVLKSMIDNLKKRRKKLFACFVDFRKAFDSVWRDGLMFKLYKWGLGNKFCSLLQNMYSQLHSCVKVGNQITDYFVSEVGTRQGCNLSPNIFNLFINDLPKLLSKANTDPVILSDKKIPILMYADDVVLLSQSESGLNRALNLLYIYCKKWKLEINTSKTKVMIFNSRKHSHLNFYLGSKHIDICERYTYLGFVLTPSGKFKSCMEHLAAKAKRAYNSYRFNMTPQSGCPVQVLQLLFDSLVTPVALYGAEIWGLADVKLSSTDTTAIDKLFFKKNVHSNLVNSFCKFTLQVHSKTSNVACQRELGVWPFVIPIIASTLKFYLRAKHSEKTSLLNCALNSQLKINHSSSHNIEQIANMMNCNLMSDNTKMAIKKVGTTIQNKLRVNCEKVSVNRIQESSKLMLLHNTIGTFKAKTYLRIIRNPAWRKAYTSWRISCHFLPIETGRRSGIIRSDRICTKCDHNIMGDESHALFTCNNECLRKLRGIYYNKILTISPQLSQMSHNDKLLYILSNHDIDILPITAQWFACINKLYAESK